MSDEKMKYNSLGEELPDDTPVEMPLRFRNKSVRLGDIRATIRDELSRVAHEEGKETFEEADDFEIEDEDLPHSPYELKEMQEDFPIQRPPKKVVDKKPKKADTKVEVKPDEEIDNGESGTEGGSGKDADVESD